MGLSLRSLLDRYFYKEEVQNALHDIGLGISGNKGQLIRRVITNWASHNRDAYDLLDFLDRDTLATMCKDYGLEADGSRSMLKQRIVDADLLGIGIHLATEPIRTHEPTLSWVRRLRFRYPLWVSLLVTVLFYFLLPSVGLHEISNQLETMILFFLGVWGALHLVQKRT